MNLRDKICWMEVLIFIKFMNARTKEDLWLSVVFSQNFMLLWFRDLDSPVKKHRI